jgi:hypothetical protein
MSIAPLVTFVAAVLLAVIFEAVYAYLDSRLILQMEQWEYTMLYWLFVVTLGFATGVIPHRPPDFPKDWVAFFLLILIHFVLSSMYPGPFTSRQASSGHSGGTPAGSQNSGNKPQEVESNCIKNCDDNSSNYPSE